MKYTIYIFLIACFSCHSTATNQSNAVTTATAVDTASKRDHLPNAVIKYLDSLPRSKYDISKILLPNGKMLSVYLAEIEQRRIKENTNKLIFLTDPPNAQLSQLIALFASHAIDITTRDNHIFPGGSSVEPAQTGLCYNYSEKDFSYRQKMYPASCSLKVYGLDCSGFIYQVFQLSGCPNMLKGAAVDQSDPTNLNNAIAGVVTGVTATDQGKLTSASILSGDIIYWDQLKGASASHIGIALKSSDGSVVVFQSNGTDSDCDANMAVGRGPRTFTLDNPYWFGTDADWKILRYTIQ